MKVMFNFGNMNIVGRLVSISQALCVTLITLLLLGSGNGEVAKQQAEIADYSQGEMISKITIDTKAEVAADLASDFQSSMPKTNSAVPQTALMAKATTPAVASSTNLIQIGGNSIPIQKTNTTKENASYPVVWHYQHSTGGKMLYGHNSANVFGVLSNLPVGTVFSVTVDGTTVNYQIQHKEIVTKYQYETGAMLDYIFDGIYNGAKYDLNLTTCAGSLTDGGDATHRLIVFANRI